jgi:hypothetical protein
MKREESRRAMSNFQIRMTKEIQLTKDEWCQRAGARITHHKSPTVCFVIRHLSFVI